MRPDTQALAPAGLMAGPAPARDEPARGTPLRADLPDALCLDLDWHFVAPIGIAVHSLREDGEPVFVPAHVRRPGGVETGIARTPLAHRDAHDPHVSVGPIFQTLLHRSGRTCVAVHHAIGATDVRYAESRFCGPWRTVITNAGH